jgi:hypothetical protein
MGPRARLVYARLRHERRWGAAATRRRARAGRRWCVRCWLAARESTRRTVRAVRRCTGAAVLHLAQRLVGARHCHTTMFPCTGRVGLPSQGSRLRCRALRPCEAPSGSPLCASLPRPAAAFLVRRRAASAGKAEAVRALVEEGRAQLDAQVWRARDSCVPASRTAQGRPAANAATLRACATCGGLRLPSASEPPGCCRAPCAVCRAATGQDGRDGAACGGAVRPGSGGVLSRQQGRGARGMLGAARLCLTLAWACQ